MSALKLYIAVLDEFPDYMTPTLVAHAVLAAHLMFHNSPYEDGKQYNQWIEKSFKKCLVRVNQREFDKIASLPDVYLGHENTTLEGRKACAVVCPREETPNVLKFAKLWAPKRVEVDRDELARILELVASEGLNHPRNLDAAIDAISDLYGV